MKVRVLGCSVAINRDVATTIFLSDDDIFIDITVGVSAFSLKEKRRVQTSLRLKLSLSVNI